MQSAVRAKLWDLLAALPIASWFGLVAYSALLELARATDWAQAPFERATQLANAGFALIMIALFTLRPAAIAQPRDWRAIAICLLGALAPMTIVLLPRGAASPALLTFSNGLVLAATLASIVIVLWLGRAFSILPQARMLVTSGPYRVVRHPRYLAEFVALFGLALQFALPWSLLLWIFAVAAQFPRMHFEEGALRRGFPAYDDYAARTARLLPGLY